ncbi:MAG: AsmA-like C-terminal region-containing protein [Chitinophagaceae bacterium]
MKKALKITGVTLVTLIALAFLIPVVFKKQVQAFVKREINKNLNATIDFSDVKLSLFRHFPKATITIKGLSIVGKDVFSKDTLLSAEKIDLTAGLFSVLKGKDIKVTGAYFQSPRIQVLVNKNGKANWDIVNKRPDITGEKDTTASNFKLSLKKYRINNGYFVYDDKQSNTFIETKGLEHEGSGNLTADIFTLSTSTRAESAWLTQDNIPYLYNTKTDIDAAIKIDNKTNTYTFKTDDITFNALKLSAEGFIQMINAQTFNMDVKFKSPTNNFKDILSMIPALYKKDFDNIKTSGNAVFNGFVKGTFSPEQIPAYEVNLQIKNGSFQYPDLPQPVKNIQLAFQAVNKDGRPDNSVIDVSNGHLEMNNEPFDFHFTYKNPETIQILDAGAKGKLDLSQLSRIIKLENGTKISGLAWADAFVNGPLQALKEQSGSFTAGGFFDIRNLFYSDKNFPQPIQNGNIKATLTNSGGIADKTIIDISSGHVELGKDPIDFTLQLSNPVSSVNFSGHAKGRFTLDHLKQFTKLAPGTIISGILNTDADFSGSRSALNRGEYDKILLNGTAGFVNLNYTSKDYPTGISIPAAQFLFNSKNVTLSNLTGKYLSTNFTANGNLNNLTGYVIKGQLLTGNLLVAADKLNLNDWMGTPVSGAVEVPVTTVSSSGKPFLIPAGINFTVNTTIQQLLYDKVGYTNVSGVLLMNDEKATFQNIKTTALDGTILIDGSYSTKINKVKPDISLSYDIKNMDVQKAFTSYNTIRFLMPIGKFLSGKLHSQLSMVGNLDGQMMPVLNSLTGKGNLLLLEGVLAKFAPLEKIAAVLQIDRLKSISVKDIKNYIEFSNGKVMVKPFTVKIKDIEMEIAGFHGFDQSIDYAIKMKFPRTVMGTKGNNLVNDLVAKAKAKGVPVSVGETVNLNLKLTGSINNPSLSVDLKELAGDAMKEIEQQAKNFAQAKLDSAAKKTKDSLNAVKKQVEDKAKEKLAEVGIDTTNLSIKNAKDTLKKRATDTLKKKIKKFIGGN